MAERITPTFQGEIQLRRWSESSTQGVQVTFALADSDDLGKFKGLEGKRFMAVLVQLGDDEQPVDARDSDIKKEREPLGDLCWRAVQWCNEIEFFEFIRPIYDRAMGGSGKGWGDVTPKDVGGHVGYCRHAVLVLCEVDSRKKLDTDRAAAERFNRLIRGPYQKHLMARGLA